MRVMLKLVLVDSDGGWNRTAVVVSVLQTRLTLERLGWPCKLTERANSKSGSVNR